MEFFFQLIYTDYAYFKNKNHINIFCSEIWAERIHGWFTFNSVFDVPFLHPRLLPLLLAEISNGLKKRIIWNCSMSFGSKIENQASDYMLLDVSSPFHSSAIFEKCLSLWVTFRVNTENEYSFMEKNLNGAHIPKLGHGELLPSLVRRKP